MSTNTTDLSLDDRIAAAFGDDITSDEVATLTNEASGASRSANEAAEQARARALDPTLSARQVAEARRQMEDAAFARDRLSAAVPRLQQRRKELLAAEEDARRWVAYEKAKAERDRLAEELAHVYPPIAEQIAELVARIETNDQQIEHINARALPSGAERLQVVELVARGVPGFSFAPERHVEVPRITKDLRLPAFEYTGRSQVYMWPPSR